MPMTKKSSIWDSALYAFRPLIIAQGEVLYAYNRLQENFFSAFMFAMASERPNGFSHNPDIYSYALTLWHSFQSDRLQRDFVLIALENIPTGLKIKEGVERLEWAKKQVDRLSHYRNIITHTPMTYAPTKDMMKRLALVPRIGGVSTKSKDSDRLLQIKSVRFWKTIRNDLLNLNDY